MRAEGFKVSIDRVKLLILLTTLHISIAVGQLINSDMLNYVNIIILVTNQMLLLFYENTIGKLLLPVLF